MLRWKRWRRRKRLIEHLERCERKLVAQVGEIDKQREIIEHLIVKQRAMNLLVGCTGPCNADYMDHPEQVTEEMVKYVERTAERLRHWWDRGGVAAQEAFRAKWKL